MLAARASPLSEGIEHDVNGSYQAKMWVLKCSKQATDLDLDEKSEFLNDYSEPQFWDDWSQKLPIRLPVRVNGPIMPPGLTPGSRYCVLSKAIKSHLTYASFPPLKWEQSFKDWSQDDAAGNLLLSLVHTETNPSSTSLFKAAKRHLFKKKNHLSRSFLGKISMFILNSTVLGSCLPDTIGVVIWHKPKEVLSLFLPMHTSKEHG